MKNTSIEKSFIESIKSDRLNNLATDISELALDSMLEDGVAKDIPVFGMLVNIYHAASHIKEGLFARKLYKFLSEIQNTSQDERERIVNEISSKKGGEKAAGATLLGLIDKLDDEAKPEFIGKLYIACAQGKINVDQLLRISNIISATYIDDLLKLADIESKNKFTLEQMNAYVSSGLMTSSIEKPNNFSSGYSLKALGEAIFNHGLKFEYKFTDEAKIIAEVCLGVELRKSSNVFDWSKEQP